jgi:MFS family permease
MLFYAVIVAVMVVPLAWFFLRPPPAVPAFGALHHGPPAGTRVSGLRPNIAFGLLCCAMFCCCMTMSMPMQHIVSLCSDLGIGPAHGAAMLSVLLGSAFVARQFWGWLSDRIGGTRTILFGSIAQATAMTGFLLTQDEVGLFAVSAAFGMGYAGLIPAYILAIRDHYPASEASWRVPVVNFAGLLGMAGGGWTAGFLYDQFASYGIAFAAGLSFNILNLLIIAPLALRDRPATGRFTQTA